MSYEKNKDCICRRLLGAAVSVEYVALELRKIGCQNTNSHKKPTTELCLGKIHIHFSSTLLKKL